jgi:hypothetical protein
MRIKASHRLAIRGCENGPATVVFEAGVRKWIDLASAATVISLVAS